MSNFGFQVFDLDNDNDGNDLHLNQDDAPPQNTTAAAQTVQAKTATKGKSTKSGCDFTSDQKAKMISNEPGIRMFRREGQNFVCIAHEHGFSNQNTADGTCSATYSNSNAIRKFNHLFNDHKIASTDYDNFVKELRERAVQLEKNKQQLAAGSASSSSAPRMLQIPINESMNAAGEMLPKYDPKFFADRGAPDASGNFNPDTKKKNVKRVCDILFLSSIFCLNYYLA